MAWNPDYRTSAFDVRMAYISVNIEKGVTLKMSDYYPDRKGVMKAEVLYCQSFSIKKYGSIQNAIIAAKKIRNHYGPDIMGRRYLWLQDRYRLEMSNNQSGKVGVFHDYKRDRFIAYCPFETVYFCYGPKSELTEEKAFTKAVAARKRMEYEHWESIEDVIDWVHNDPDVTDIQPKIIIGKKSNRKNTKKAA